MNKKVYAVIISVILLACTSVSAFAESGTVVITAGTLSVTAADVTLSGITLNGSNQTSTSDSGSNSWSAQDLRGTGAGWNLTIVADDFSDGTHTIDTEAVGSKFQIQLLDTNVAIVFGNTKPVSSVNTLTDIPNSTPLKFLSAGTDTGMGSYTLNPNFALQVPASTYAGTYTSTITVTAATGP